MFRIILTHIVFGSILLSGATPYSGYVAEYEEDKKSAPPSDTFAAQSEPRSRLSVYASPQHYNSIFEKNPDYIPELYNQGALISATQAFKNAAASFACKSFPLQELPTGTQYIDRAIAEALGEHFISHPHFIHITQHMRLMVELMVAMRDTAEDALEDPRHLRSILQNTQSLKRFLQTAIQCVESGYIPKPCKKILRETCRALHTLIQIDFGRLSTRKATQPITPFEHLAALASGSVLLDFSHFKNSQYPAVEQYNELLATIRSLHTCQTTMAHIDATITARNLKNPDHSKSVYLSIVRYFCTDSLQQVMDLYSTQDNGKEEAKIYFYVLELYLQICHLGNLPLLYTAQTANPFTGLQTIPHYVESLFRVSPRVIVNPYATANIIEEFGVDKDALLEKLVVRKDYPASQHTALNPSWSVYDVASKQHLVPSILVYTPSDTPLVSRDIAYLFLTESRSPVKALCTIVDHTLLTMHRHTRFLNTRACFIFSTPAQTVRQQQQTWWQNLSDALHNRFDRQQSSQNDLEMQKMSK